ncbi:MAG: endopeptidase La [Desulfovibrionaceae bacterium]|nr:endopeptidase La [Desulfovibrionaceae bacterium]
MSDVTAVVDDQQLPLLPLREVVMFPGAIMPLFVGRDASIKSIEAAQAEHNRYLFLAAQQPGATTDQSAIIIFNMGVVSRVLQVLRLPDGTIKVLFEGLYRATWKDLETDSDFLKVTVQKVDDIEGNAEEGLALVQSMHEALNEYAKVNRKIPGDVIKTLQAISKPGHLADAVLPHLRADTEKRQSVLEELDRTKRLEMAYELLEGEIALAGVEKRIKNRVKVQMERNQREYYLTEQIKAINREMGRDDDPKAEAVELEQKIKAKDMPVEAQERAYAELRKLRAMQPAAAEYTVVRNYIDWIIDLPWNNLKEIDIDLDKARSILDGDHYGLEKPKERILEYLAVQKLSNGLKGPILCFVGPPGVGKTSLAKSVAKATGREFVRLSLGGVRDEAEIRGHRRTYVGALPGKILQSLKRVQFNNPLFCLDEIDKMSNDYRGDPASALLEVFDPEQNSTFMDHYLDLDYDLSKIFFITTANSLHNVQDPLIDRMEIIELPSYLETEKRHIARNYLLPRQLQEHGLKEGNIRLSENALNQVIRTYTREAGVRNLERELGALCRKTAIRLVESKDLSQCVNITTQNLSGFLGVPRFHHEERESEARVGVCAGLAFTKAGGEILMVETTIMSGHGQIVITGSLGDVMKESAKAALTYVRSRADELGLDPKFYRKIDIHVHVPDGSTPKDGPSAGITIATSVTSALLGVPVRNDVSMTGEISLRGRVLPIGGLREKLFAAKRGGIKKVIVPKDNEKDLRDVPQEVLKDLEIVLVDQVDDVLLNALDASAETIFSGRATAVPLYTTLRKGANNSETDADDKDPDIADDNADLSTEDLDKEDRL